MVNKDGHVTTVDTRELKWPYLSSLVQRGKKFRLEGDMDEVFRELRESLNDYTAWAARNCPRRLAALETWADAVYDKCRANWVLKMQDSKFRPCAPKGYPGLRKAVREAHKHLVFLHDDRAPHGLVVVCKRWYQTKMVQYLADSNVFETCDITWNQVVDKAKEFNLKWGFRTGTGVVYNYGIWKPTKGKFRYIAGTRANANLGQEERRKQVGPPRQPLFFAHKLLVRLL